MLHNNRQWGVASIDTAEELAHKLTQFTWTGCQAFSFANYIFANDSTSGDGAKEYAVLRPCENGQIAQIESITFGWCTDGRALELIQQVVAGDFDSTVVTRLNRSRFRPAEEHVACYLCQ